MITMHADNNILVLPLSYHHCLQALIYNMMGSELADDLHRESILKSFVFSQLSGEYLLDNRNKVITFASSVSFSISSLDDYLLMKTMRNCFKNKNNYYLMKQRIIIDDVLPVKSSFVEQEEYHIRMASPVTVHKTELIDGKRKTIYFKPGTNDFAQAINDNLIHKIDFYKKGISRENIVVEPVGKIKEVATLYKNFTIIGYMGDFLLKCKKEQLEFLYDVGLGTKNSQGFGLFDLIGVKRQ